jgi:hypothetical protein
MEALNMLRRRTAVTLLLFFTWAVVWGQSVPQREDAVKAAFIYRIAGYVEWPPAALAKPEFTIAVLGSDRVAAELTRLLAQRSLKHLPARARTISSPAAAKDAHILFIGKSYVGDVQALIDSLGAKPVLVVTDDIDGLEHGAAVNFVPMDRRVRFEISLSAANRAGLKIGADLLSVAARVRGAPLRSDVRCGPSGTWDDFGVLCVPRVAALWSR